MPYPSGGQILLAKRGGVAREPGRAIDTDSDRALNVERPANTWRVLDVAFHSPPALVHARNRPRRKCQRGGSRRSDRRPRGKSLVARSNRSGASDRPATRVSIRVGIARWIWVPIGAAGNALSDGHRRKIGAPTVRSAGSRLRGYLRTIRPEVQGYGRRVFETPHV